MVIAKTASRNVAFKVARMRESITIMEDQDEFMMRKLDGHERRMHFNIDDVENGRHLEIS